MIPEQEQAFCREMTKRLHQYEKVMRSLQRNKNVFLPSCHICSCFRDSDGHLVCDACPLYQGCNVSLCGHPTRARAMDAMYADDPVPVRRAAIRAHYEWLISRIKAAGFTYK